MESKVVTKTLADFERRRQEAMALARELLAEGDPERALAAARRKDRRFSLPEPLEACSRCHRHAALYSNPGRGGGEFICGVCGPRVSIFTLPVAWYDLAQVAADVALVASGKHDLKGTLTPKVWEGD